MFMPRYRLRILTCAIFGEEGAGRSAVFAVLRTPGEVQSVNREFQPVLSLRRISLLSAELGGGEAGLALEEVAELVLLAEPAQAGNMGDGQVGCQIVRRATETGSGTVSTSLHQA